MVIKSSFIIPLSTLIVLLTPTCQADVDFVYHRHPELETYLLNINATYPDLTNLYSIGKSIQGEFAPNLTTLQDSLDQCPMLIRIQAFIQTTSQYLHFIYGLNSGAGSTTHFIGIDWHWALTLPKSYLNQENRILGTSSLLRMQLLVMVLGFDSITTNFTTISPPTFL